MFARLFFASKSAVSSGSIEKWSLVAAARGCYCYFCMCVLESTGKWRRAPTSVRSRRRGGEAKGVENSPGQNAVMSKAGRLERSAPVHAWYGTPARKRWGLIKFSFRKIKIRVVSKSNLRCFVCQTWIAFLMILKKSLRRYDLNGCFIKQHHKFQTCFRYNVQMYIFCT